MDHEPAQAEAPSVRPSILGDLRKSRGKIGAGADPLDLVVPGYNDKLLIRFRWVPPEDLAATSKSLVAIKNPTKQNQAAAADAIVAACEEIMVREDDEIVPLSTNEFPITFADGERLAFALGFPNPNSARECCAAVFNNPYAMGDVALRLMQWLEDTSRRVSEEQLGE